MDENNSPPLWKVLFGATVITIVAFGLPIGRFIAAIGLDFVGGILGIPIGAYFIWKAVNWLNCRDDPRTAKRPPDAP